MMLRPMAEFQHRHKHRVSIGISTRWREAQLSETDLFGGLYNKDPPETTRTLPIFPHNARIAAHPSENVSEF